MPKTAKGATKAKSRGVEKKKKGAQCHTHHTFTADSHRPQRTQAWPVRLHVLRQRPARECSRGQPRHQLWYVVISCRRIGSARLTQSPGQVGKVLGDRWKALSEKQREPYEKKAAADKKRYEDEKAKYNVS